MSWLARVKTVLDRTQIKLFSRLIGPLAVVILAILSLVPGSMRPHTGAPGNLEHIVAYLLTAGLLSFGYGKNRNPAVIALCLSFFSATAEIAQIYIPDRHADFFDFAASSTGAFIGSALAWIIVRALSPDAAWDRNKRRSRRNFVWPKYKTNLIKEPIPILAKRTTCEQDAGTQDPRPSSEVR
jgi:VanZ family protein